MPGVFVRLFSYLIHIPCWREPSPRFPSSSIDRNDCKIGSIHAQVILINLVEARP